MLKESNILALVGGGKVPYFPPNRLTILDDHQGKIVSQMRFNDNILNVRLRMDRIIVIFEQKIYIFNLNTLETISEIETYPNYSGIIGISNGEDNKLFIAYPFGFQGCVQILDCFMQRYEKISTIPAHDSKLAYLALNKDGKILATASDKGTIFRIYNVSDGIKLTEFRRGTKNAQINNLCFSPNNKFFACSSDGGTIHIFSVIGIMKTINKDDKNNEDEEEPKNTKNMLGKIGGLLKIKSLEKDRSFTRFKVQEEYSFVGLGNDNTFVVITKNGKYYKGAYDPKKGGDCCKIDEKNIFLDK